jgi:hypothetical protein
MTRQLPAVEPFTEDFGLPRRPPLPIFELPKQSLDLASFGIPTQGPTLGCLECHRDVRTHFEMNGYGSGLFCDRCWGVFVQWDG